MRHKDFLELNLPIGTKVRFEENEWLFIGLGKSGTEITIQLARGVEENSSPSYDCVYSWDSNEIEVIEYPVKYGTLQKYHIGDIVYGFYEKFMVVDNRNSDGEYTLFSYHTLDVEYRKENYLTLEPREIPTGDIKATDDDLEEEKEGE
jgi:hypothetical protein